ncbi:MAG: 50S ribosomal protein L22 [Desulfomonile tiedjei]|nr:50S ribosomal protein L22 [Desulfomonile tiedjei]
MEWESTLRYAHISARKARLVADLVRGKPVGPALGVLRFTPKKAAAMIRKVLQSALDNASQSSGVNEDKLFISSITVDEGPTAKRWSPRAMGRATRIRKRTSHIRVALQEK